MNHSEIIQGYLANVFMIRYYREQIAWNQRHGLPALDMPQRLRELLHLVATFETILSTIPDKRARIVLRCRFALGMSIPDTAEFLGITRQHVARISRDALRLAG